MKAIVAVAASMLTAAYYMLRDSNDYHDLGATHVQRGDQARLVAGLTHRLHQLGYEVTLRPAA
jgi:transposase